MERELIFDKLHEECGVFGIITRSGEDVVPMTYRALYALQHRGQESCGMAVNATASSPATRTSAS